MAKTMQLKAYVPANADIIALWRQIKQYQDAGAYLGGERPMYTVGFVGDEAVGQDIIGILRSVPGCEIYSPTHQLQDNA